jgi:hypothetical protein
MRSMGNESAEARYERIASGFRGRPDVSEGTGFGSNPGLRVGGRIFAMLVRGELVVKLPANRVRGLLDTGAGNPFDAGKGRRLREWASVPIEHADRWEALAGEAFEFVGSA